MRLPVKEEKVSKTRPISPLVSILVCAFNEEKYIDACIRSCLGQTWPAVEVVFFNDGSSDRTLEIVNNTYLGEQRVKILSSPGNVGKIAGFNSCYAACTGAYIHLMGGDDVMEPACIEMCMAEAVRQRSDAVYHGLAIVDQDLGANGLRVMDVKFASLVPGFAIAQKASVPSGAWLLKRDIADKILPIPLEIPYEDVWISAMVKNSRKKVGVINKDLILYRQHAKNTYGVFNTSFEKAKFRYKRDLQYLKFVTTRRPFHIELREYEMLMEKRHEIERIIACDSYGEVLFAAIPWNSKMMILRNSTLLLLSIKEKIKSLRSKMSNADTM